MLCGLSWCCVGKAGVVYVELVLRRQSWCCVGKAGVV